MDNRHQDSQIKQQICEQVKYSGHRVSVLKTDTPVSLVGGWHSWSTRISRFYQEWLRANYFMRCRDKLFTGEVINSSENQAAWHTALRYKASERIPPLESAILDQVCAAKQDMKSWSEKIRSGCYRLSTGKRVKSVIHIGTGGSFWGPKMCYESFKQEHCPAVAVYFVSSMDSYAVKSLFEQLDPTETLVVLVTKSFATEEVLYQANAVRDWVSHTGCDVKRHFFAVTAFKARAVMWGVSEEHVLPLWPWIGGRFSVWSAVSFCWVIAFGMPVYDAFLEGAAVMDQHFYHQPFEKNLPVRLACWSSMYTDLCQYKSYAVIPYASGLCFLPQYMQQLMMESLGKGVTLDGQKQECSACPVVFGDIGTRSQHALSQYFMQSPDPVPLDIIARKPELGNDSSYRVWAHVQAQSELLTAGYHDKHNAYKDLYAGRPHSVLSLDDFSSRSLGALLALYEHKVFVIGALYRINIFDQWGVEQSKHVAAEYYAKLSV